MLHISDIIPQGKARGGESLLTLDGALITQLWNTYIQTHVVCICWIHWSTYKKSYAKTPYLHLRFYAGAGGVGNCSPPTRRCPNQMWHETLFDKLKASPYRENKERSVACEIHQNALLAGALPRTPGPHWGSSRCSPDSLVGLVANNTSSIAGVPMPPQYFSLLHASAY